MSLSSSLSPPPPPFRQNLHRALERAEAQGRIQRVTGKGFTGSFRLAHPYYPPPRELWGDWYEKEEEESEEEEEEEYIPKKKRGRPATRRRRRP